MTTTDYTDLPTLKAHIGITDSARDSNLSAIITAASREIDGYCGRRFYLDSVTSARVYNPARRVFNDALLVDDIGDSAGLVVETGSNASGWATLTVDTDYELMPENALARGVAVNGILRLSGTFMTGNYSSLLWAYSKQDRVRVTAKWGWPAVPPEVTLATLILAARLFKRRESVEGVLGNNEWGTVRLSRTDPDVAELLTRYVLLAAV